MSGNKSFNGFGGLTRNPIGGGGFRFVLYVKLSDILTFGDYIPSTGYHSGLTLKTGGNYYTAVLPPSSRSYVEQPQRGAGGPYSDVSVESTLPFISPGNELTLEAMMYERYVLLVQLPNNVVKLVGTPDNPVRFASGYNSGETISGTSGTRIQFTWQCAGKVPVLSPTDLTTVYQYLQTL